MLYLISTPIGNLGDITYRAIEILQTCDYILCEDTRHSLVLLNHYKISKPLKSLHKFNEAAREKEVLADLEKGLQIGLISDAGTPGIADPGSRLVQKCVEKALPVQAIPGPCSAIAALTPSGLNTERFQFVGFLPRKRGELTDTLEEISTYKGTTICFESPNRLADTLEIISTIMPQRTLVIARELTKKFEEFLRGTAEELMQQLQKKPPKGEIVLLISENKGGETTWDALTLEQHVLQVEEDLGLTRQEAIKVVAKLRGLSKRLIYNSIMR